MVPTAWRTLIGHMLTVDKHLIPFTGADRCNYNFIIRGKPKGGTYQFRPGYAAFLGSTRMALLDSRPRDGLGQLAARVSPCMSFGTRVGMRKSQYA